MGLYVCGGAVLCCSFGAAPTVLNILPQNKVVSTMPIATVMDNKPFVNILPFAMCNSISNPTVAAATAAARGVLTPMPCVPVITAPWSPGKVSVQINGQSALTDSSECCCMWSGVIKVAFAGQVTIMTS